VGGGDGDLQPSSEEKFGGESQTNIPFTLRRHKVVQAELPVNLFKTQVNSIVIELSLWDTLS
jgi:hypothetical protein